MAVTIEVEEGRAWDAAKVKSLTGGDRITARGMRQDFFDFDPKFKLLIAGNDKPVIRKTDEAFRHRLHVVPFSVKIERPDLTFREKPKQEWPGILAWMIDGCLIWQKQGLSAPRFVTDATAEYLQEQDVVGRWIEENCDLKPNVKTPIGDLFQSWQDWCAKTDEQPGSIKAFGTALMERPALSRAQIGHDRTRAIIGIRFKADPIAAPPQELTEEHIASQ
jgi:putative DNA primase/helicase